MPYNVLSAAEAAQKLPSVPSGAGDSKRTRRSSKQRRKGSNSGRPDDVLNVSAVMDQMQNANEREYVASVPRNVEQGGLPEDSGRR